MTNTSLLQTPFQKLLGPVSREEFFDRYWQKQSLLVQDRGDRGWPFTFDRDAFFGSLEQCSHLKMVFENEDGAHRECQIQAPQAARMYEAGNTLCATRVDNGNADLHRFLRKLERELWGGEFHTNAYLSPGNKGFGTHFDYHSVWVLQIEGRKRWWFGDTPALTDPLTTIVYPMDRETLRLPWYAIDRPDESAFHEVVLEPGDMLYLPTGVWHKTRADEYSLSITLGHEPVQAGKLVSDHIAHAMWSDDACPSPLAGRAQRRRRRGSIGRRCESDHRRRARRAPVPPR